MVGLALRLVEDVLDFASGSVVFRLNLRISIKFGKWNVLWRVE